MKLVLMQSQVLLIDNLKISALRFLIIGKDRDSFSVLLSITIIMDEICSPLPIIKPYSPYKRMAYQQGSLSEVNKNWKLSRCTLFILTCFPKTNKLFDLFPVRFGVFCPLFRSKEGQKKFQQQPAFHQDQEAKCLP